MSSKATISTGDFICAPATPTGARSAIAVIRASGGREGKIFAALREHFTTAQGKHATQLKPRIAHYGYFTDGDEIIDDVLLVRFDAPHSFTGEDAFEISCHGNPLIVGRILEVLYALGFRKAEPGEFTRRAYLNGKLSLDAAQAIGEIIAARSRSLLRSAQQLQRGAFRNALYALRSELMNLVADLHAELDFSDDDIAFADQEKKLTLLSNMATRTRMLAIDAERLETFKDGVNVVIVGAPNAGKSSLLNRLLGHERSIVSAIPGTTRDYIEAEFELSGFPVRLFDTAGLRKAESGSIEEIGIGRTRELMNRAHIIIVLVDGSEPSGEHPFAVSVENNAPRLCVVNKCDTLHADWTAQPFLQISAKTGAGLEKLRQELAAMVAQLAPTDALPLSLWQRQNLADIAEILRQAMATVEAREVPEVTVHIVEQALERIAELTGEISSEDILGRIFSRFCIGK